MKKLGYFLILMLLQITYMPLYTMLARRTLSSGIRPLSPVAARMSPETRAIISHPQFNQKIGTRWYSSEPPKIQISQETSKSSSPGLVERLLQWWRGNPQDVIEKVENEEYTGLASLYTFLKKNNQKNINSLLDKLVLGETNDGSGIVALEHITDKIWWKLPAGGTLNQIGWDLKPKVIILRKLTDWTTLRLMELLKQEGNKDATLDFIKRLFEFDRDQKISSAIIQNLQAICQTNTGLGLIQLISWQANRARSGLIEQSRYEKSHEEMLGVGERAFKLWKDILRTINDNRELFSPMLEKTYTGQNILSLADKKRTQAKKEATQTIIE